MRFEVLGTLRASHEGRDVTPPGRVQRLLLASLLLQANRLVSTDVLGATIWPEHASSRTHANVQVAVHRLRARLDDPARIAREPGGYRLRVAEDEFDLAEFNALATRLLIHDLPPAETSAVAGEALALWRGDAVGDVAEVQTSPEVMLCEERHRWVFEVWCEAEITLGRSSALIGELTARAQAEPLHERFALLLMRAFRASGRNADALVAYDRARAALRDELGVDPGAELQDEHMRALTAEPAVAAVGPAQLPPATELVGRDGDLADVGGPGTRLCVISGTAGVGKTAMALSWAHRHAAEYPDGQLFVDLRGFSEDSPLEPAAALEICLRSLGVPSEQIPMGEVERSALFRSLLAARRVLVVLDNARTSAQARPLLPGSETCTTLITSRDLLPGLVAREGAAAVGLGPLKEDAAVALLESAIGPRAAAEPDSLRHLARLCGALPLALRVVAQQVVMRADLPIADLVHEVADGRDRLDLLDVGDGESTNLRAVLSWSYESLDAASARVFRLLGLLPGEDADIPALAALCGVTRREVRDLLAVLVRANLVERTRTGRYRQHDLLRTYAAELARDVDRVAERTVALSRLLLSYACSAEAAEEVSGLAEPREWATSLRGNVEAAKPSNVVQAQEWMNSEARNVWACVEQAGTDDAPAVFALCHVFSTYMLESGGLGQGLRMESQALTLARAVDSPAEEYRALLRIGNYRLTRAAFNDAERAYRSAAEVAERSGRTNEAASAYGNLGLVALGRGRLSEAEKSLQAAVAVKRREGTRQSVMIGLGSLGSCALQAGELERAQEFFEAAAKVAEEESPLVRSEYLVGLADVAIERGEPRRSERLAEEAERVLRGAHRPVSEAAARAARGRALVALGRTSDGQAVLSEALVTARAHGDAEERIKVLMRYAAAMAWQSDAVTAYRAAVQFAREHGFQGHEAAMRRDLGEVLLREGDPARAAEELATAAALYTDLEDPRADQVASRLGTVEAMTGAARKVAHPTGG